MTSDAAKACREELLSTRANFKDDSLQFKDFSNVFKDNELLTPKSTIFKDFSSMLRTTG